jgi:GNAT superfamily N-acetyltransferase
MIARRATPEDADELVRLRAVMLRGFHRGEWSDDWREQARRTLVERLDTDTMAAFVIDRPREEPPGGGLASCVIGTIETRLGGPSDASGRTGYVFNVATDPDMRRRGFSRQCMTALLDWFREQGVRKTDLRASAEGEPLYSSLGFVRTADPAMRLHL